MRWRETLLLDVPMRRSVTVERTQLVDKQDPRFVDGVLTITSGGRFFLDLQRQHAPFRPKQSYVGVAIPLRASQTIEHAGRTLAAGHLSQTVVDGDEAPIGILGWDDVIRFALAHGASGRWARRPARDATRPEHAITPIANGRRLDGAVTVGDVARALLAGPIALGTQNDAQQHWMTEGIVTPCDLLRVIFPA